MPSLGATVANKRRSRVRLHYPHALEQQFAQSLSPVVRACQEALERIIIPALPTYGLSTTVKFQDAVTARLTLLGRNAASAVVRSYDPKLMKRLLFAQGQKVNAFQHRQLAQALTKATTIKGLTGRIIEERASEKLVNGFVAENVALIERIPKAYFASIENKIKNAVRDGTRIETLTKNLLGTLDFPKNRARLIARDQVGALYGQLNKTRQTAVGIKRYVWRTMADERVRETHALLDGTTQDWGDPPETDDAGNTNDPGEDYQCRCTAEPDLEGLD